MDVTTCNWYAVYVRSRHEFKIEKDLTGKGIEVFLPFFRVQRKWTDRRKLVALPLFPGYLFVNIDKSSSQKKEVLRARGVVRYICMRPGEPEPVCDAQIISIRKLVNNEVPLDPYPYLKEGRRVRIRSGPLAGVEGLLTKREDKNLLVLSVDLLQKGAALKIDASDVEAI